MELTQWFTTLALATFAGCGSNWRNPDPVPTSPPVPPPSAPGDPVNGFGGGNVEIDPSVGTDVPYAAWSNGTDLFVVGDDFVASGQGRWNMQKLTYGTATPVPVFGTSGVVTSDPSAANGDAATALVVDTTYLYVAGYDRSGGINNAQWRIEKRLRSDGSLVTGFGALGVLVSNPGAADDRVTAMTSDGTALFVAGYDETPGTGNTQWRLEKRSLATGALIVGFGTGGVVQNNPSTGRDEPRHLLVQGADLYVVGFDQTGGGQWRIERRLLTTGALVAAFGAGGVVVTDPSLGADHANSAVTDGTDLYVAGFDEVGGDRRWRVEKRSLTSGALVNGFGSAGVLFSDPSSGADTLHDIATDGTALYLAGSDDTPGGGQTQLRCEKRSPSTGNLDSIWNGGAGVVTIDPSSGADEWTIAVADANFLTLIGLARRLQVGAGEWRLDRRFK